MGGEVDLIAEELEKLHGGDAGIEVVEVGELVAEEVDTAEFFPKGRKGTAASEPAAQGDGIEPGHGAVRMEAE